MGALRLSHGLFDEPLPSSRSPVYEFLRLGGEGDANANRWKLARYHCEDLWADFRHLADSNFKTEFASQTHARWFEMYLAVSLLAGWT